jgi:spore germination protein GerM
MNNDLTPHDDANDPTAARLRAALNAEAAMVHTDDQLSSIRERTEGAARPWWQRPALVAVAAAVILGLAVGGGVALLNDDEPTVVAGGDASTEPATTAESTPSETPSTSEGTATPTAAEASEEVWVYYVMDDGGTPRLYREQHTVEPTPGSGGGVPAATMALDEMFRTAPEDSDYRSAWPQEPLLRGYSVEGDTATVKLADFVQAGAAYENIAVQQVVYTVTANDKAVKTVRLLVDGKAPPSGHQDWSEPVARAPMVEVQGLIWLLSPSQGEAVSSPVEIAGYGTAFEGTISWEVRREGSDEVVADGFTQGGSMGEFAEFSDSVVLEPGTYEMRAFESSAENGEPIHVDTKTFTVE